MTQYIWLLDPYENFFMPFLGLLSSAFLCEDLCHRDWILQTAYPSLLIELTFLAFTQQKVLAIDWRMAEKEKLGYFFSLPASGSISGSYMFSVAPAPIWKQVKKHSPYLRNEELCSTSLREQYLYTLFRILLYGRFTSSLSSNF